MARRIMHVLEPAPYGGSEAVVTALARGAAAREDLVHVVMPRQSTLHESSLSELVSLRNIEVTEINCGRRRYLSEIAEIERVIRAWRPSVVHTHVYHSDVIGFFAARRARVPVVSTIHGLYGGSLKVRCYEWIDLQVQRHMDRVICVSETVANRVLRAGVSPERVRIVPNGRAESNPLGRAAARVALGLPESGEMIGWIGRFSHEKGPDLFVDAIAQLDGNARGIMIGDGVETPMIAKRIATSNARVTLLGSRPQAGHFVTAFDVLAITSRSEGLPMTALDAMAAGVPIVATAVGALPQVLRNDAGWLVALGQDAALSAGFRAALADPAEAQRRALRARERIAAEYSLDQWIDRVNAVYDEIIA